MSSAKKDQIELTPEDPPVVKQLKELDDKYLELERECEKEVQKLHQRFTARQQPLLSERKEVLTKPSAEGVGAPLVGTPALAGFWLKALQNHPAFEDCIQEWDKPVLEYLADVETINLDEADSSKGFKLTLRFVENPYFSSIELTKEYTTEEANPYCSEIKVKEIKSTTIEWKAGKDVTVEKVVKKAKGGKKPKQKGKEKLEPRPSFFRQFFRNLKAGDPLPPDAKMEAMEMGEGDFDEDDDGDDAALCEYFMEGDHEVGTALRDHIIPFAVRWYTGEASPEGFGEVDSDEEEEEEEEEESESEEEPPSKGKHGKGKAKEKEKKKTKASPELKPSDEPKEECKQQ